MDQQPPRERLHLVDLLINNFDENVEISLVFSDWEDHTVNLDFKIFAGWSSRRNYQCEIKHRINVKSGILVLKD